MIGKLLATTALLLVFTGAATAQSTDTMMASGYQMTATDALASKVIGSAVYTTLAAPAATPAPADTTAPAATPAPAPAPADTTAPAATPAPADTTAPANPADGANAQQIGTVRDLVLGSDGKVSAVVIGVGGFLGMGEKNVAVSYTDLHWTVALDGSVRASLDTTEDALKAAPDFTYPANNQAAKGAPAGAADNAAAMTPAANSNTTAPAPNAAATAPARGVDVSSLKPADMGAMKTDDLKGVDVLDPAGQKIASVNDLVLTSDGKVDAVIVDFGGFLGIGTKQIALAYDGLNFMDDANGKHYLVVNVTKDQLSAQKAYNKDDFAANRESELLTVAP